MRPSTLTEVLLKEALQARLELVDLCSTLLPEPEHAPAAAPTRLQLRQRAAKPRYTEPEENEEEKVGADAEVMQRSLSRLARC